MGQKVRTAAVAAALGCSRQNVDKLAKRGVLIRDAKGLFDLEECIERYHEQTDPERRAAANRLDTPKGPTGKPIKGTKPPPKKKDTSKLDQSNEVYLQARASKAAYAAKLEELKFREANGELINAEDAKRTSQEIARTVRDNVLRLEKRLLPYMTEEGQDELRKEIRLALEEMHKSVEEI